MEPPVYGDRDVMLKDHATTLDLYKVLVDTRFKLLTFVPTVTTIAVGILSFGNHQRIFEERTTLLVGLAGLVTSLAIVVYEIRNSQIHDRTIHRIKHLERLLGFTPSYAGRSPRGMFDERGKGELLFGLFAVQHDRALSMVYGVVLTLWTWVFLTGIGDFVGWFDGQLAWLELVGRAVLAVIIGLAMAFEITRQGGIGREPQLVYTLADIVLQTDQKTATDLGAISGNKIWEMLKEVQSQVSCPMSKDQLIDKMQNLESSCGAATTDNRKLLDLAVASGMITFRQRTRPPWNPRRGEDRAQALQVMEPGPLPSRESLAEAIVGAQEILAYFPDGEPPREMNIEMPPKAVAPLRTRMMERYGSEAPWCSWEEVRLRCELLSAASDRS